MPGVRAGYLYKDSRFRSLSTTDKAIPQISIKYSILILKNLNPIPILNTLLNMGKEDVMVKVRSLLHPSTTKESTASDSGTIVSLTE